VSTGGPAAADFAPLAAELEARLGGRPASLLYLSRNDLEPGRALEAAWPGTRVVTRTKADFQAKGLGAILKELRREAFDVFVLHDRPVFTARLDDFYRLASVGIRARRRFLLSADVRGGRPAGAWRWTPVRVPADLVPLAARLAGEAVRTAALLVATPVGLALRPTDRKRVRLPASRPYRIAYLKTDYAFGVTAGGSVSHTAGVVGGLLAAGHEVAFFASDDVPGADTARTPVTVIRPGDDVRIFDEAAMVAFHHRFVREARRPLAAWRPDLLYQRHSLLNAAGAVLSADLGVPLLLEANNSEVQARRMWSRLVLGGLAARMERAAFRGADAVVAVSRIGADSLPPLGADPAKLLVNPNGVDPARFHPGLDGTALRRRLGFEERHVVCGFLGTFTRWHGVLFLAERIPKALAAQPDARFLFMGDGDLRSAVEDHLRRAGVADRAVFTGLIPHGAVPEHLAACDVLISPHLPFEDGTPFFGSPTKLFEYMAMGKPVLASNLGQIGEVIEDGKSGILYGPGNADEFDRRLRPLLADAELRRRLGEGARLRVESEYTWRRNAERAIAFLEERVAARSGNEAVA
jgi:glycosyltransferase involved in cell wall biosynthesis